MVALIVLSIVCIVPAAIWEGIVALYHKAESRRQTRFLRERLKYRWE